MHHFTSQGRRFRWEEIALPPDVPWTRHDEDGQPHLAYYCKKYELSFVWDGNVGNSIQVCPGGYGEPIRYLIHTDNLFPETPALLAAFLPHYASICRAWTKRIFEEKEKT